jgi:hypothetical protein
MSGIPNRSIGTRLTMGFGAVIGVFVLLAGAVGRFRV